MHIPDTETPAEDGAVVLLDQPTGSAEPAEAAPAKKTKTAKKAAADKPAPKKAAAKEKPMTTKTTKKPAAKAAKPKAEKKPAAKAAKPKAEKKAPKAAKPKAEKKPAKPKAEKKAKRPKGVAGVKAQGQVSVEVFKCITKAAKEDGSKAADFVRDAIITAVDRRFGTTFKKDAKAAAAA